MRPILSQNRTSVPFGVNVWGSYPDTEQLYPRFLPDQTTKTGPILTENPTGFDTGSGPTLAEILAGLYTESDGG